MTLSTDEDYFFEMMCDLDRDGMRDLLKSTYGFFEGLAICGDHRGINMVTNLIQIYTDRRLP